MGRRILVSGFSDVSREWANRQPRDVEIWAMNEAHIYLAPHALEQTKLWFQIHPRDFKEKEKTALGVPTKIPPMTFARGIKHVEFLRACPVPVIMHAREAPYEDIPNSRPFPLEEIGRRYGLEGRPYLTSTPAYMMAYVLLEDDLARERGDAGARVEEVRLSGIEFRVAKEFFIERMCFEFYMGRYLERGIKITVPPQGTSLLNSPVYAIDAPVILPPVYDPKVHKTFPIFAPNARSGYVLSREPRDGELPRVHLASPEEEALAIKQEEERLAARAASENEKAGLPQG